MPFGNTGPSSMTSSPSPDATSRAKIRPGSEFFAGIGVAARVGEPQPPVGTEGEVVGTVEAQAGDLGRHGRRRHRRS